MTENDRALTLFAQYAFESMRLVVPEKEDELRSIMSEHGATLEITEDAGLSIRVTWARDASRLPVIQASRPALAFLWATVYLHTVHYRWAKACWEAAAEIPPREVAPMSDAGARAVFSWALANRDRDPKDREPWPDDLPGPRFGDTAEENGPLMREATNNALAATAWILHHELEHVRGEHVRVTANAVADERQADKAATHWLLDSAPDLDTLEWRALGPTFALIALLAQELERRPIPKALRDHPAPEERLLDSLMHPKLGPDHFSYHVGVAGIGYHMRAAQLAVPIGPYDTAWDALLACLEELRAWRRAHDG